MNDTTKEIKKLADWCQKARAIIGKGFVGDASTMESQIKKVAELLNKLNKQAQIDGGGSNKELLDITMEGFRQAASEHQSLTEAYEQAKAAKKNAKKGTKAYEDAAALVTATREKVRRLIQKMAVMKEDLIADAPLAQAVHHFEVSVKNARIRIENELTNEHSDKVKLNGVKRTLDAWVKEVDENPKYDVVANVQELTNQINPLLNTVIGVAVKQSAQTRKVDGKQSKARGPAEKRLAEVKQLLADLKTSGELASSIETQLTEGIRAAEALHTQEQWIEGGALLKKLPSRKTCQKAFDTARGKSTVDFRADLEQVNIALASLKLEADVATWKRYDTATKLLQGRTVAPVEDNVALLGDFRTHLSGMKEEIRSALATKGRLATTLGELEKQAGTLTLVAPLNRVEENLRQIQLIEVLQGERRWSEAEDTAKQLKLFMDQQASPDYETWKTAGRDLRGRSATLNALRLAVGNPAATPALKAQAGQLLQGIAEPRLLQMEKDREWSALMALHAEATKFELGLAGEIEKFKGFADGRKEIDANVQPRIVRCENALFELERALETAGATAAPVLAPLKERMAELKADWKQRLASAADESDMNQGQMEQDLNVLMQSVLSANVGNNLAEATDTQGQEEFDKAVAALEKGDLAALEKVSVLAALEFRKELVALAENRALDTDPTAPWAQRLLGVAPIAERVKTSLTETVTACAELNQQLTGKAEAVALVLSAAKKEMQSKGLWDTLGKRYAPMFKLLEDELAGLRQLLDTSNATGAAANGRLLADLKKRADELVQLATHNKQLDNREDRVDGAAKTLETLRKDKLDKLAAETNKRLGEQLKALRRDMFGMEPQIMNQALAEMTEALDAARVELDGVLKQLTEVANLEKDLRPRIAKLQQSRAAPDYFAKLLERVGEAVKQSAVPADLGKAKLALDAIGTEVKEAEDNPAAALSRQKLQKSEEHAAERLKQEYKGRLAAIKDDAIPRVTRAIREAGGDEGQIDEINRMIKMAEKAADNGDHARAIQTLVRTNARVLEVEKNPAGTALGDRKALPKHLETFAGQMNGLRTKLDDFVKAAVALAPEAGRAAVKQSLDATVLKIKAQLNPRLFDLYSVTIIDSDKPKDERRAARDQALQRLRDLSGFLNAQPTVAELRDNPILPLRGPMRLVDSSLTRLEAHLRAAIR